MKAERLGPACCGCSTNTGPSVARVGEVRGEAWERWSERERGDHVGFKLQQQPRLFRFRACLCAVSLLLVVVLPPNNISFYQFVKILSAILTDSCH